MGVVSSMKGPTLSEPIFDVRDENGSRRAAMRTEISEILMRAVMASAFGSQTIGARNQVVERMRKAQSKIEELIADIQSIPTVES